LALQGESGRHWYNYATEQVKGAAFILDIDSDRLSDLLALFSPRVSVKRNIRVTLAYLATGKHGKGTMKGTKAAVTHYELTGDIRGPKTSAFAKALQGDLSAVVLDTWMADAFGIDQSRFSVKAVHRECCKRIRAVAGELGWKPAEVQAAIWVAVVRQSGRAVVPYALVEKNLFGTILVESAS